MPDQPDQKVEETRGEKQDLSFLIQRIAGDIAEIQSRASEARASSGPMVASVDDVVREVSEINWGPSSKKNEFFGPLLEGVSPRSGQTWEVNINTDGSDSMSLQNGGPDSKFNHVIVRPEREWTQMDSGKRTREPAQLVVTNTVEHQERVYVFPIKERVI